MLVSIQSVQSVLDKTINVEHVKTAVVYIFTKYVHCDMRLLVIKINALLCFLNDFGIAIPVLSY